MSTTIVLCVHALGITGLLATHTGNSQLPSPPCPHQCVCQSVLYDITVDCNYRKLTSFPALIELEAILESSVDEEGVAPGAIHLLANGNRFRYLLPTKLSGVAFRLCGLEAEHNGHVFDVTPDVFAEPGLATRLEKLRLGPVRTDMSALFDRLYTFTRLTELSITGDVSTYGEQGSAKGHEAVTLKASFIPSALRALSLVKVGALEVTGEPGEQVALVEVTLRGVRLLHVPPLVKKLSWTSIEHLDLSRNALAGLWEDEGQYPGQRSEVGAGDRREGKECKLVSLDLSYNRISALTSGLLVACPHLKNLDLSHNALLSLVQPGALRGLSALALDLSFTSVTSLAGLSPDEVSEVKVYGSSLECTCALQAFIMPWLDQQKVKGTCHRHSGPFSLVDLNQLNLDCTVVTTTSDDPLKIYPTPATPPDEEMNGYGETGGGMDNEATPTSRQEEHRDTPGGNEDEGRTATSPLIVPQDTETKQDDQGDPRVEWALSTGERQDEQTKDVLIEEIDPASYLDGEADTPEVDAVTVSNEEDSYSWETTDGYSRDDTVHPSVDQSLESVHRHHHHQHSLDSGQDFKGHAKDHGTNFDHIEPEQEMQVDGSQAHSHNEASIIDTTEHGDSGEIASVSHKGHHQTESSSPRLTLFVFAACVLHGFFLFAAFFTANHSTKA